MKATDFHFSSEDVVSEADAMLVVYGTPLGQSADTLLSEYRRCSLEGFLRNQLRHSVGDYVLLDRQHSDGMTRVITSMGYCGGYISSGNGQIIITTVLRDLLHEIGARGIGLNRDALLRYVGTDITRFPPFETVFEGVRRLPAAFVVEIADGSIVRQQSYLTAAVESPGSFALALEETMAAVASNYDREALTIMLSGGMDSASILVALTRIGHVPGSLVSLDYGNLSNHPARARRVAGSLGRQVEEIDFVEASNSDNFCDELEACLRRDFVNPLNPSWGIIKALNATHTKRVVISGQNFDALAVLDMHRKQLPFLTYVAKTGDARSLLRDLVWNLQFCDSYADRSFLQQLLLKAVPCRLRERRKGDGINDFLSGFLSTGKPYILSEHGTALVRQEVTRLMASLKTSDKRRIIDSFYYYYYCANCSQLLVKFELLSGDKVVLPAMSGPMFSYFTSQRRGLITALAPKKQIVEYVTKEGGVPFYKLTSSGSLENRRSWSTEYGRFRLLERNVDILRAAKDRLLPIVGDAESARDIESCIDDVCNKLQSRQALRRQEAQFAMRCLNLEMIVQAVL